MKARRYVARAIGAIVVLLVAVFTYPGAVATSILVALTPPPTLSSPAPPGTLPWLHVEHPSGAVPYIADDKGRMVLLRGMTPQGLIDFYSTADPSLVGPPPFYPIDPSAYDGGCPDNSRFIHSTPLCQADVMAMPTFGFNLMRLPLSWSLLEPQRGRVNQTYVDRIAQVVGWARTAGLYVIIDMHQNAYSRYVGRPASTSLPGSAKPDLNYNTGAPAWATLTDGFPSETYLGQREINPAALEANSNFWYDRGGIQDEYIASVATLAKRFKDDSTVIGYSAFNEPLPGWNLPPGFEDQLLFPFYRRVIDAITGIRDGLPCWTGFYMPAFCGYRDLGVHDLRHIFFMETGLLRHVADFPTHLALPVSSYPNLVLSFHAYTHVFSIDKLMKLDPKSYPWGGYDQTYALAEREAKAVRAAPFVAEFGNFHSDDSTILATQLLEQERHLFGSAFWAWKENGDWGLYEQANPNLSPMPSSGCLRVARERLFARVYPRASADRSLTYHYDTDTGAFTLQGHGHAADPPTLVYVPPEVTGQISSAGAAATPSIAVNPDGSRLVTVVPSGGAFSVAVAPATLALTGCL
jgi:endoglycosylceramidase